MRQRPSVRRERRLGAFLGLLADGRGRSRGGGHRGACVAPAGRASSPKLVHLRGWQLLPRRCPRSGASGSRCACARPCHGAPCNPSRLSRLGGERRREEAARRAGTQLVGHVGQELGLMAAGGLQLAAPVGDLVEEPGVLDRQGRLGGERAQQLELDCLGRESRRDYGSPRGSRSAGLRGPSARRGWPGCRARSGCGPR